MRIRQSSHVNKLFPQSDLRGTIATKSVPYTTAALLMQAARLDPRVHQRIDPRIGRLGSGAGAAHRRHHHDKPVRKGFGTTQDGTALDRSQKLQSDTEWSALPRSMATTRSP